jgi:hypothetical protein
MFLVGGYSFTWHRGMVGKIVWGGGMFLNCCCTQNKIQ